MMALVEMAERRQLWKEAVVSCAKITDGLGKGIDAGILDVVVAFRVLGINTTGSCEGHSDGGSLAPWVDIEAVVSVEEQRPGRIAQQKAQEEEHLGRLPKEEIWELYRQARALKYEVSCKHLLEREKV